MTRCFFFTDFLTSTVHHCKLFIWWCDIATCLHQMPSILMRISPLPIHVPLFPLNLNTMSWFIFKKNWHCQWRASFINGRNYYWHDHIEKTMANNNTKKNWLSIMKQVCTVGKAGGRPSFRTTVACHVCGSDCSSSSRCRRCVNSGLD